MLYLLKLSISLSVIWLFYQLMLRRLTFYNLHRWYLLGYSLLSFIIPLIDIGSFLDKDGFQKAVVIQYIPAIGAYQKDASAADPGLFSRLSSQNIGMGILLTGSLILLGRLLSRWLSLRRVRVRARLISDGGVKIFQVDQSILPFSFGNAIYINQQLHTEKEYSAIILHEYVHIRQKHTIDMVLSEVLCILNWYNPFAWLIRYSIRQNLEFIADRKVLENGMDRKGYQYHLLQVVGTPRYRLANNFNFSSLKKRIIMMNKIKSAKMHLLKFLFIVPLLAVLLLAFRKRINAEISQLPVKGAPVRDTLPKLRTDTLQKLRKDTLSKKADSAKPLFVVNGVVMKHWRMGELAPDDIKSIDVLKGEAAVEAYGTAALNGVVRITTKDGKGLPLDVEYILDGVEIPLEKMQSLSTSDIESINILRGDSAVQQYGEKAHNGVVLVQTKEKRTVKEEKTMMVDGKNDDQITIRADSIDLDPSKDPHKVYIYFINGVRAPAGVSGQSLIHRADLVMLECTEKDAILKKYGLETNQTIMNVVTRESRNNPAAYMLYRLNQ